MATAKKPATATASVKAGKPLNKSTALANVKSTLPANFEEQHAADIARFKERLAVSESSRIQVTQDKHFKVPNGDAQTDKVATVRGIIVDFSTRKAYYEADFDRDNPAPPNCFAIGFTQHDNLLPDPASPDPQHDICRGCQHNSFTQLPNGKWQAKGCKDTYRLALISPDGSGDAKLMTLDVSATSVREFDKYVRGLANMGKAPYQVITEFSFDPAKEYPSVRFSMDDDVPRNAMGMVVDQRDEAAKLVALPPNLDNFEERVVAKRAPAPKPRKRA
jgi:hypothetical protein